MSCLRRVDFKDQRFRPCLKHCFHSGVDTAAYSHETLRLEELAKICWLRVEFQHLGVNP